MQIDLKNCTVKFKDGSGRELEVKTGEGYVKWSEKKPRQYTRKLVSLHDVRNGDEEPMDVSFEFNWDFIKSNVLLESNPNTAKENGYYLAEGWEFSGTTIDFNTRYYWTNEFEGGSYRSDSGVFIKLTNPGPTRRLRFGNFSEEDGNYYETPNGSYSSFPTSVADTVVWTATETPIATLVTTGTLTWVSLEEPSIEDVLKQTNGASIWTSTDSDPCRPYCIDIEIVHDPLCSGVDSETVLLPRFRYETLDHDLRGTKISCSGKSAATEATVTRP